MAVELLRLKGTKNAKHQDREPRWKAFLIDHTRSCSAAQCLSECPLRVCSEPEESMGEGCALQRRDGARVGGEKGGEGLRAEGPWP